MKIPADLIPWSVILLFLSSAAASHGTFHHIAQNTCAPWLSPEDKIHGLNPFVPVGYLFVALFFFCSGYGLMKSKQNKPGYFKGFFRKRFPAILIPFYLCILIFLATEFLSGQRYNVTEWFAYLSGWLLINSHMWYIVEIALLYAVFYLLFCFIKKEHFAILGMFLFLCLLTAGSLLLGHGEYWFQGEWWYNSSLIFLLGILMAYREESILTFLKKHYFFYCIY